MPELSKLVDFKGGGTPSKSVKAYWGGNIPWASVKDFKASKLNKTIDFITEEGLKNSSSNLIPAGNLIVPTRMALGKVATNTIDIAINQDLRALIVKDDLLVSKSYLLRFLESKAKYLKNEGKGATVKGITLDVLKNLQVPLPPLETQKQIAQVLATADQLRKDCQQVEQELNTLAQSVFLEMFGDPVTNPKGWKEQNFSELIHSFKYGSSVKSGDHGTPILRIPNVTGGKISLSDLRHVLLSKNELEKNKTFFKKSENEYMDLAGESVVKLDNIYKKEDLKKQRLLISVEPTIESLKADINKAIRRIKTLEFSLEDISQKSIIYWGLTDSHVADYLQHENIKMLGLYETLYYADETLKNFEDDDIPF